MPTPAAIEHSTPVIQTMDLRIRKLVVQSMQKNYLYYRVREANNTVKCYETVQVPMYISPPSMGTWIERGDPLPDSTSSAIAMAEQTNRFLVVPTSLDLLDQMIHENNPDRLFDTSDLRTMEAAWAIRRTIADGMWNGAGGKQPDGLTTAIEKLAPSAQVATVMGIDKAVEAWFRNQYVQLTANFGFLAGGSSVPAGFLAMLSLIQQCTNGTLKPTDLLTTQAVFEVLRRAMLETSSPYHMLTKYDVAHLGFENFKFYGSFIGWDDGCPADSMYALHLAQEFNPQWTGDPRDKAKMDRDLEDIAHEKLLTLDGSLAMLVSPNINMRRIAPRSPYKQLQQTEWMIHAFNWAYMRMSDNGVLGSDNGSRLQTW